MEENRQTAFGRRIELPSITDNTSLCNDFKDEERGGLPAPL